MKTEGEWLALVISWTTLPIKIADIIYLLIKLGLEKETN